MNSCDWSVSRFLAYLDYGSVRRLLVVAMNSVRFILCALIAFVPHVFGQDKVNIV